MTDAFVYPPAPHVRKHGPAGYADYESYRPWLRDEFTFRCVYCLTREAWGPLTGLFALDHFVPVSLRPDWAMEYDNLLYACASCNSIKGCQQTPDPLAVLTFPVVRVREDGSLETRSSEANKLIERLRLDRPRLCEFRRMWMRIVRLVAADPALLGQLMGFPNDLPDLTSLRPPGGNSRPEGLADSCYSRRRRGELPATY